MMRTAGESLTDAMAERLGGFSRNVAVIEASSAVSGETRQYACMPRSGHAGACDSWHAVPTGAAQGSQHDQPRPAIERSAFRMALTPIPMLVTPDETRNDTPTMRPA